MKNKITVVICLYNAEKYIFETLESLNAQTFNEFDLLILDDCSQDKSIDVVEKYLENCNFLTHEIIKFEENKGTAFLRDFALRHVQTPLMMFFDADDVAFPQLINSLYKKISTDDKYIAISCYSRYIDENSKPIVGGHFLGPVTEDEFKYKAIQGKLLLMPNVTLFKREIAIAAGGYRLTGFPVGAIRYQDLSEDLDLWSRMSDCYSTGRVMITIPKVLYSYRKNTNSLSSNNISLISMQNKIRFIKKNIKRRRRGDLELTFKEYLASCTTVEKARNYLKDLSAFHYRKAGFLFVRKSYFLFMYNIIFSVILNPFYIVDKFKSNILKKGSLSEK